MEYVYVSNLNNVDELLIKCIREWVKGIYHSYNPIPILNFLLSKYKISKTSIPIDDFMKHIVVSTVKKHDFKFPCCCTVGISEQRILSMLYNVQNKNYDMVNLLVGQLFDKKYYKIAYLCSELICRDFNEVGLFFNNSKKIIEHNALENIIKYDFKNKKFL